MARTSVSDRGTATVTLDASGNGTKAVTFASTSVFTQTPDILVQSRLGDAGTYSATVTSKTGFTVNVATSDVVSQDVQVEWFAMEKAGS